jgi:hypothetical protein
MNTGNITNFELLKTIEGVEPLMEKKEKNLKKWSLMLLVRLNIDFSLMGDNALSLIGKSFEYSYLC